MSEGSETASEEERSIFRPFTRESIALIETRIEDEAARKKELEEKKKGEVRQLSRCNLNNVKFYML